jgi:hypothetical protein
MCTAVLSFQPEDPVPLLLLGARDEFTDRSWRPPGRHWAGSPLVGGIDEQAGGTWLAVHPARRRVGWLLNGRGRLAAPGGRRSRGELPLRAAGTGAGVLKELADDPGALAAYDPFHLLCGDTGSVLLLSWDGTDAAITDLAPGTHVITNAGHSYPAPEITEPKAAHFGPKFAAVRPSGDPALPLAQAWGAWLTLADGDGLAPDSPGAIVARRPLPGGRIWGSTSQSLVALARGGGDGREGLRYDFRPVPGEWSEVPVQNLGTA